jgi:hypothetical protein
VKLLNQVRVSLQLIRRLMSLYCPLGSFSIQAGSDTSCLSTLGITSEASISTALSTATGASHTTASTLDPAPPRHNSSGTTIKAVAIAVPILVVAIITALVSLIVFRRHQKQAVRAGKEYVPETQHKMGNNDSLLSNPPTATVLPASAMDYYSPTPTPFVIPSAISSLPQVFTPKPPQKPGGFTHPPVPYSPTPDSVVSSISPPAYQTLTSLYGSGSMETPYVVPLPGESVQDYDDEIGKYSTSHRDVIPPDLEQRLRIARYLPTDDPNEIPADVWSSQHGVGYFELKRLQELYET